jgi:hypothetical protein
LEQIERPGIGIWREKTQVFGWTMRQQHHKQTYCDRNTGVSESSVINLFWRTVNPVNDVIKSTDACIVYFVTIRLLAGDVSAIDRAQNPKYWSVKDLSVLMESEQQVIIRFLDNEKVPAEQIHTRLVQSFDDQTYCLRNVERWCLVVSQGPPGPAR